MINRRTLLAAIGISPIAAALPAIAAAPRLTGVVRWQEIAGASLYQITVRNRSTGALLDYIVNPNSKNYEPIRRFPVHDPYHVFNVQVHALMDDGRLRSPGAMLDFE